MGWCVGWVGAVWDGGKLSNVMTWKVQMLITSYFIVRKLSLLAVALVIVGVGSMSPARATLITFEGLADGTIITNQFAGVTFSSNAGFVNAVTTQAGIGFGANFICTAPSGTPLAINCKQETFLTFATGVDNLSFFQVGDNAVGTVGLVDVFTGGAFDATVNILGDNNFSSPVLVDLSAFSNVTSIRIYSITDPSGLGFDNFNFDIPEPTTLSLFLVGLAGLGFMTRRRRNRRRQN